MRLGKRSTVVQPLAQSLSPCLIKSDVLKVFPLCNVTIDLRNFSHNDVKRFEQYLAFRKLSMLVSCATFRFCTERCYVNHSRTILRLSPYSTTLDLSPSRGLYFVCVTAFICSRIGFVGSCMYLHHKLLLLINFEAVVPKIACM